jgi:3-oxoacyl-[acyl-carrier protein] reductase
MCKGGARASWIRTGSTMNVLTPGRSTPRSWVAGSSRSVRPRCQPASLGRVGQPEEIAATVAFLLSDGAGYINAATTQIDGGKHMH